jgi:hypothetical protein
MIGLLLRELVSFIGSNWGCISVVGLIGYLSGSLVTRKIMAPDFCPRCIRRNQWLEELKRDPNAQEETKRFAWLRRKKKPED